MCPYTGALTRQFGEPKLTKSTNPKYKDEEEALRKRFTEQVKQEEARFRQWESQLINERDRLNSAPANPLSRS